MCSREGKFRNTVVSKLKYHYMKNFKEKSLPPTIRLNKTSFCLIQLLSKYFLFIVQFSLQIRFILLLCNTPAYTILDRLVLWCFVLSVAKECYRQLRTANRGEGIGFFKLWVPGFYLFCSLQCFVTGFLVYFFKYTNVIFCIAFEISFKRSNF